MRDRAFQSVFNNLLVKCQPSLTTPSCVAKFMLVNGNEEHRLHVQDQGMGRVAAVEVVSRPLGAT